MSAHEGKRDHVAFQLPTVMKFRLDDCSEFVTVKHNQHCIFASWTDSVSEHNWQGIDIGRREWSAGSVAFLPQNSELKCRPDRPQISTAVVLDNRLFVEASQEQIDFSRIDFRFADVSDVSVQLLLRSMQHIAESPAAADWPMLMEANAMALTVAVIRILSPDAIIKLDCREFGLNGPTKKRVVNYVESNLHRNITLRELAEVAGLSTYHFQRMFKRRFGVTPGEYVAIRRIELVKRRLISSYDGLAMIAHDCGFSSQSHLTRVFKKLVGATPAAFRNGR